MQSDWISFFFAWWWWWRWFNEWTVQLRTLQLVPSPTGPHPARGNSGVCMCIHVCLVWSVFPTAFIVPCAHHLSVCRQLHSDSPAHYTPYLDVEWGRNKVQPRWRIEPGPSDRQPDTLTTALFRPFFLGTMTYVLYRNFQHDVIAWIIWQRSHHGHPLLTQKKHCFYKGQLLTYRCSYFCSHLKY